MSKKQDPTTAPNPLSPEEITDALARSGFPLEMRLLRVLEDGGADPSISSRFLMAPGDSAEVDLMARWNLGLDAWSGFARATATIEAKKLGPRVAMVGFKWRQPNTHNLRAMRSRFRGLPSCLVTGSGDQSMVDQVLGGPRPLASVFDAFGAADVCPHWSYVREKKSNANEPPILARKEEDVRSSFLKLLRVTEWLERDSSNYLRSHPGKSPMLIIEAMLPTIVVESPQLWVYDANAQTLEPTQSLIIQESCEAAHGEVLSRHIDVITEQEVPNWMNRCRAAAEQLRDLCNERLHVLKEIAREQAGDAWSDPPE